MICTEEQKLSLILGSTTIVVIPMLLDFSDCLFSPQFYLTCCQLPFSYQILNTKQTVSAKCLWMLSFLDSRLFRKIENMPSFINPRIFKGLFDTKRLMKRPKICKEIKLWPFIPTIVLKILPSIINYASLRFVITFIP